MKGIFRFIIIALIATLGLAMVGVLYLFFIPNATLFGIDYISLNKVYRSQAYNAEKIETIDLSSRAYEVRIVPTDSKNISVKIYANTLGFVKKKYSEVKLDATITGSVLDMNVSEPHGFAWKNDSYIELYLPQTKSYNLTLNNASSKTYLTSAKLKVKEFEYTTNTGNLYLENLEISQGIDLNLSKAKCYMEGNVKLNNNDIELSMSAGDLVAPKCSFKNVTVNKNKGGTIEIKSCEIFTAKVNAGGRYSVGTADIVNIVSEDTNVNIGTITKGCSITLTKSGKVEVTNVNCPAASIETDTGSIKVKNANEAIRLKSIEGDIVVNNATKLVTAENEYGNIDITFKSDLDSYTKDTTYRSVDLKNYNGKVSVHGVDNIKLKISNKGRANIEMNNVLKASTISGNIGDISVVINKDAKFNLSATGTTGSINVNFLEFEQSGGYTEDSIPDIVQINGGSSENSLTITNKKGDIKVLDTVLAS
ncbi:MAG: DUF4097 family beta strand repeat protein [Clostridia bacterium]|nr:DUF4097 family beta strand repeat protein [Clostridia bacterium]